MFRTSAYCATVAAAAISLSACGPGDTATSLIPSATAQTPTQVNVAPIDGAELNKLIASNPVGLQGGALGRPESTTTESDGKARAQAFAPFGWSYHYPTYCMATNVGGQTYMYLYFSDNVFIYSADPNYVNLLSAACVGGRVVGVYITSNNGSYALWSHVVVYR